MALKGAGAEHKDSAGQGSGGGSQNHPCPIPSVEPRNRLAFLVFVFLVYACRFNVKPYSDMTALCGSSGLPTEKSDLQGRKM